MALRTGRWGTVGGGLAAMVLTVSAATAGSQPEGGLPRAEVRRQAAELTALGRAMFVDPSLSASGKLSCSSCHDPQHGFGPTNALPVQMGGGDMATPGMRAVPSLTYTQVVPPFTEHFFDSEDDSDESVDNGPTGGLTWDGRVDRGADQAAIPLLSDFEMGNAGPDEVVTKALAAGYGDALRRIYGDDVLEDRKALYAGILKAFEVFEQDAASFYPYSSKYDAVLAGTATLTPQEARGLDLFNDPDKGNCAECHISQRGNDGTPPQFSDYGQIAIALPRNMQIPANADPAHVDLGVCGPLRTDQKDRPEYCGLFRTPSLRNVALRQTFFHNGVFHTLRDAVAFYVTRETDPGRWYPRNPDGSVRLYDDLPAQYWDNINRDPPFDRHLGDAPALTDAEIDDVVAFLKTLTDGYHPPS
ncbi:c-type cytochrome [Mycobacterium sp. KBS0706]|uniref:cytochrome-c peroxidase n=1 Tax=Mycobacterium sp. KBS0706 TaxID=2578109 RepID=UPI00110F8EDB|nr:cytochrome c peroxidase [Mycobacterium sp. KBS0706]TSD83917.1 c-type cytochrome [Mycobacterium sp. KBS0706]